MWKWQWLWYGLSMLLHKVWLWAKDVCPKSYWELSLAWPVLLSKHRMQEWKWLPWQVSMLSRHGWKQILSPTTCTDCWQAGGVRRSCIIIVLTAFLTTWKPMADLALRICRVHLTSFDQSLTKILTRTSNVWYWNKNDLTKGKTVELMSLSVISFNAKLFI